ncbi:PREDICTED: NAC domain-containing protein 90-like [Ipomoea nil]|uniref:NAC domain-containing protein 90-like n=1 Tax=Ipomoea nil TaxID=35883 RepID=UPI000900C541|nr:PREDICTED: NAC domain-containing protein 90-like [Ipomoea nil]
MEDNCLQGFRFFPTEEELVCFYLKHKLQGDREDIDAVIPVVNIYDHCPWDLPRLVGELCRGDDPEEWFFFVDMQENISRGGRPNRLTPEGYWKASGIPTLMYSNNEIIGLRRTMIFYRGRAPTGRKTEWKMIEYKAILGQPPPTATISDVQLRHEFSLCRIYKTARLDRGFDRRPPAPAAIAVPRAAEPPSPHLQTVPEAIAAQPSSSHPQAVPESVEDSSSLQNNFWDDVCVPLWDWEGMDF